MFALVCSVRGRSINHFVGTKTMAFSESHGHGKNKANLTLRPKFIKSMNRIKYDIYTNFNIKTISVLTSLLDLKSMLGGR